MTTAIEELPVDRFAGSADMAAIAADRGAILTATTRRGIAGLESLADGWPSLATQTGGPMESFAWAQAAAGALSAEQEPLCICVARDDEVRGIAQLAGIRSSWLRRLEMLGVGRLHEPSDFVGADREALATLCTAAVRLRRPLLLNRLPRGESPTIPTFHRASRGRGVTLVRPQAACPVIPLDESWREPESHLSSRRRSDFRRAERRAEKLGPLRYEIRSPEAGDVDRLLDRAFAIEARSWKGEAGTALAVDPVRGAFIRRFAHSAAKAGALRFCFLQIGDEYAAMQIALQQADAFWLLKIGFDPAYGACSPGQLLLAESIRYAVGQGLHSFEFLGTAEDWTRVWTQHERQTVSLRFYPYNVCGLTALGVDSFVAARRKLRSRIAGPAKESIVNPAARSSTNASDGS